MSKIEIVLPGRDLPVIKEILAGADVTAYTLIENVSGFGHHGYHQGRLVFNEVASQVMIITVVPEDKVQPVFTPLMEHFQTHSGVVFASEVLVSRAHYFASTMEKRAAP
jgi:nitrogen regulatory protein PII